LLKILRLHPGGILQTGYFSLVRNINEIITDMYRHNYF
jgi:hypothetical protein